MTTIPASGEAWLRLLALPLKALVLAYGIIYPVWLYSMPGDPGTKGGPSYSVLEHLALGYLFVSVVLLGLAAAQAALSDRRGSVWSVVFAILALGITAAGVFHTHFK